MCRLKVKELVAKAHATVGDLPPAQRQIMTEVITRLDTVYVALTESIELRAAVVAENGQMLRLLTDISENHDEYVNADEYLYAGVPMDYVSEINAYVSRDVDAENPFKATDAYLAEVRAQGVEMYADNLDSGADDAERDGFDDAVKFLRSEASGVRLFAAQLRQGAEHE